MYICQACAVWYLWHDEKPRRARRVHIRRRVDAYTNAEPARLAWLPTFHGPPPLERYDHPVFDREAREEERRRQRRERVVKRKPWRTQAFVDDWVSLRQTRKFISQRVDERKRKGGKL